MKLAILLTIRDNTEIVNTLMKMLDVPRFLFYLLCDQKSKYQPRDFIPELQYAKVQNSTMPLSKI